MQKFWVGAALLFIGAGVLVWGAGQGWFDTERKQASIEADTDETEQEVTPREIPEVHEKVGGIFRPPADIRKISKKDVRPSNNRPDAFGTIFVPTKNELPSWNCLVKDIKFRFELMTFSNVNKVRFVFLKESL